MSALACPNAIRRLIYDKYRQQELHNNFTSTTPYSQFQGLMAFPIPASGLSVVTLKKKSLRLFYQLPGGPIGQSVCVDGVWSHDPPKFNAVPLSPLASVAWNEGQEVSLPPRFRCAA